MKSDVYAVVHLRREVDGIRGQRSIYVAQAVAFMERLSKRVRGKSTYRRLPHLARFLPNAVSIEKLADGPHFNVMIRKPANWGFEQFRDAFVEEWLKSAWAATDERAIDVQPRQIDSDLFGYCHKEGDEALVHETLRF